MGSLARTDSRGVGGGAVCIEVVTWLVILLLPYRRYKLRILSAAGDEIAHVS